MLPQHESCVQPCPLPFSHVPEQELVTPVRQLTGGFAKGISPCPDTLLSTDVVKSNLTQAPL